MKRNDRNTLDEQSLREKYEDALISLAFLAKAEKEAAREKEQCGDLDLPDGIDFEAANKRNISLIRRELRRNNFSAGLKRVMGTAGRVAAYVLAAMFVVATSTLAISREARVTLYRFLVTVEDKYTQLGIEEVYSMDVPDGWNGEYFPAYIPEGFEVYNVFSDISTNNVEYINDDGKILCFSEMNASSATVIDSENADIKYKMLNGSKVYQVEKDGRIALNWLYGDKYFFLTFNGDPAEAWKVTESVKMFY